MMMMSGCVVSTRQIALKAGRLLVVAMRRRRKMRKKKKRRRTAIIVTLYSSNRLIGSQTRQKSKL